MKPVTPLTPGDSSEEIATLIETLHQTGKRLEQLTGGEVDSVVNRDGQTFLLQHAQEQLRLNESARQAAILNALPASVALLDSHGVIISVNETWQQFGRANAAHNPGHDIGVNYLTVCDKARGDNAAEASRAAAGIRAVLDGKAGTFTLEYPCHSPAEQRWFLMTVTHLTGTSKGVVVMHLNITAGKLAENALRESEDEFHTLAEAMPQIVWITRPDGWNIYFNQHWMDYTGLTLEESLGHGWNKQFHPDDRRRARDAWQKAIKKTGAYSIETRLRGADGVYRWWLIRGVPLKDNNGSILKWFGTCTDIHDLKLAELELQKNQKQLSEALEIARTGYWEYEFATDEFIFNDQYYTLHKITVEEAGGYRMSSTDFASRYVYPEDTPLVAKHIQLAFESRDPNYFVMVEPRLLSGEGEIVWIDVRFGIEKDLQGNTIGLKGISQDITERKHAELKLIESERRFTDLLGNVELVSMMLDHEAGITYCNDYLLRLTGWQRKEVIGKNWWELFLPPEIQDLRNAFFTSLLDNQPEALHHDNDIVTRSGERRLIRWNNSVLRSSTGDVIGIASIGEDITEQAKSEASIKYFNRVFSVLSGINTLIVHVDDREALFRGACNIAVEAGGFRMAMLVIVDQSTMLPVSIISAGKDDELLTTIKDVMSSSEGMQTTLVAQAMREKKAVIANDTQSDPRLLFGKQYAGAGVRSMTVIPLIISDDAIGALALYASEIEFFQEDEMRLLIELAGDIAYAIDHIDKQDRLNYLAYYDVLTGLANRSLFFDRAALYIHSAISGGHKLAIGLIDLERFKNINDSLGRPAGDSLLKQMAEWLTQSTQDANLLARIDADHFAFVVPEVKTDGSLAKLVDKLMAAFLEHSFRLNDAKFRIGIKVGIALFPDDGDDINILFGNAEFALKKAKASGDRLLFYTEKMSAAVADKLTLENKLRDAIDNEEFVLHYQPKVNLVSGKVTGAEALIRWNDPRTGLVPPGMFIPVLEETGLIYEVGRWALRKAIEDNLRWCAAGLAAVRIAVNVSPLQLRNSNFTNEIRQVISLDANAAEGLELEITESLIMEDVQYSIDTLKSIRAMGITFAIDDFGTGFSSLSYLAKLPVDTLKIDRAFVIEMDTPEGLALVSTIIILAHALKLKVVAEGVETEKQSRQLLSLNCDEMQGFLFSKPVPADIFETRFLAPPAPDDDLK